MYVIRIIICGVHCSVIINEKKIRFTTNEPDKDTQKNLLLLNLYFKYLFNYFPFDFPDHVRVFGHEKNN